jgi:hypothetical protein
LAFCLFVRCPPLVKISIWAHFWWLWLYLCFIQVKIMLGVCGSQLIERLRAQTTRTKTPVLATIFRVQMTSESPYLNPHISAESLRMNTTKRPHFIKTSRRIILPSQKYFAFIFTSNCYDDVMVTSPQQASC